MQLFEARTRPSINPKTSLLDYLLQHDREVEYVGADGVPSVFVSFTKEEKLGINPRSTFEPVGIYAYPANYVLDKIRDGSDPHKSLPYAGSQPWANIFRISGHIINLGAVSESDCQIYYSQLPAVLCHYDAELSHQDAILVVDCWVDRSSRLATRNTTGGRLWYVLLSIANHELRMNSAHVTFNKMMRMMGVDGLYDPGVGIIYPSEPTQLVMFTKSATFDNVQIPNRYNKASKVIAQAAGMAAHNLLVDVKDVLSHKADNDEIVALVREVRKTSPALFRYFTDEEHQLIAVQLCPSSVKHFNHPTDRVVIAAIEASPRMVIPVLTKMSPAVLTVANRLAPDLVGNLVS